MVPAATVTFLSTLFSKNDSPDNSPEKGRPKSAHDWVLKAEEAEDKDDWSRAIVCYRKALSQAPFSRELRARFEDAIQEQLFQVFEEKGGLPVSKKAHRPRFSNFAMVDDFSEWDEEEGEMDETLKGLPDEDGWEQGATGVGEKIKSKRKKTSENDVEAAGWGDLLGKLPAQRGLPLAPSISGVFSRPAMSLFPWKAR